MTTVHKYMISAVLLVLWTGLAGRQTDSLTFTKRAKASEAVQAIGQDPVFEGAVLSICVMNGYGEILAELNPETMAVPASNMKLITTGAAIHTLGSDFRFSTGIGYKGRITDGVLDGDLYIIGGGDPTLASKGSIATPLEQTFSQWKECISKAGIKKIEGRIIGDGRWFDGMAEEESWVWNDIGTYYGTGSSALMFYENIQSFSVTPGQVVGAPVNITPYHPSVPWMEFRYNCSTGEKGTGDKLYMYTSDLAPVAEIRGTYGIDRGHKIVECSNKYPEYTCAEYFTEWLEENGIGCSGKAADTRFKTDWMDDHRTDSLTIIGSVMSPELKRIIFETNHASNNLYAETLFRTLGKRNLGSATYGTSAKAMNDILRKMGLDITRGIHIKDGSGLSRQNYASSDFFCRFLEAMMHSQAFEDYVESLPSPGGNGTLQFNMKSCPAESKARIKVKSGSMNGVRCYSGYIIPREGTKDETIIFSILTNNCTSPTWKVRPLLDKLMASLAELN